MTATMYPLLITLLLVVGGSADLSISDFINMGPVMTCRPRNMMACFRKNPDFLINSNTVQNSQCYQFTENATASCVIVSLQYGQCGVVSYQNVSHVTYNSSLYISQDFVLTIMRNNTLTANAVCVYPLDMVSSLNFVLKPFLKNIVVNSTEAGQFSLFMSLYRYSNYTGVYSNISSDGLSVPTKTKLYFGLFTDAGDTTFVLLMRNCYATPSADPTDSLKYYIIQNICPITDDVTISVPENGVSKYGRFQVDAFKFKGDYDSVYFHCAVRLCNNRTEACRPSCGGRSADQSSADEATLTLGPLSVSSAGGLRASWAALLAALALMMSTMFQQSL